MPTQPFRHRNLPRLLLQARESVMAHTRPGLRDQGLSDQQWRVLRVLGEDHGDLPLARQAPGELHEAQSFLCTQAGRGFVHEDDARRLAQAQGQLKPLDPSIRHASRRLPRLVG